MRSRLKTAFEMTYSSDLKRCLSQVFFFRSALDFSELKSSSPTISSRRDAALRDVIGRSLLRTMFSILCSVSSSIISHPKKIVFARQLFRECSGYSALPLLFTRRPPSCFSGRSRPQFQRYAWRFRSLSPFGFNLDFLK